MPAPPSLPQLRFDFHPNLALDLDFQAPRLSSNGGLLLLRKLDDQLGLLARLAPLLPDARDPARLQHSRLEQLRQRVFQIACGYEDQNDAASLRHDPLFLIACGRPPDDPKGLSSQPSLSRFEHAVSARHVVALQHALEDDYVASLPQDTTALVLEIDATDDPVHGQQQLSFFNAYYDTDMYFPLLVFDDTGRLASVRLRAGNVGNNKYARALLVRLIRKLKARFPSLLIAVRGDSGFCSPRLFDALDRLHDELGDVFYVIGMSVNQTLRAQAQAALDEAEAEYDRTMQPARRYLMVSYKSRGWSYARQVVIKAEFLPKGANPRFVVTNLDHVGPRLLYEGGYCGRGEAENSIKDFKRALACDRLSNTTYVANAFRLLLHAMAYRLMDALRRQVAQQAPALAQVQMDTLREGLVKVAASVRTRTQATRVSLPQAFPMALLFVRVAQRLGASRREPPCPAGSAVAVAA